MSDHVWFSENLATYLAEGLDLAERERFEVHLASCASCAALAASLRDVDQKMTTLFIGVRPSSGFEDKVIQSLRKQERLWHPLTFIPRTIMKTAVAIVLLGITGGVADNFILQGKLPFPDQWSSDFYLLKGLARSKESKKADGGGLLSLKEEHLEDSTPMLLGVTPSILIDDDTRGGGNQKTEPLLAEQPRTPSDRPGIVGGMVTEQSPFQRQLQVYPGQTLNIPKGAKGEVALSVSPGGVLSKRENQVLAEGRHAVKENLRDRMSDSETDARRNVEKLQVQNGTAWKRGALVAPNRDLQEKEKKLGKFEKDELASAKKPADGKEEARPAPAPPSAEASRKIIIRTGEVEFEIESFDQAVAIITKLVNDIKEGGFISTVNSEKLPNGKVRGSLVVRVPPARLDAFVLDIRRDLAKTGELKNQRIGSQDVTKQYVDLESRLRAAHTMEERLLQIIKTGKGEVKDLLQVEKELGVWRTRIEEMEGELRYLANQVSLSTLTITLAEREIRSPAGVTETEEVQMGVEVVDVEKAQQEALAATATLKGRVLKAEIKLQTGGQYHAELLLEVPSENAKPLQDRLAKLGEVARREINRLQQSEGGTGRPLDAKLKHKDTKFAVNLYNVATIPPRETYQMSLASADAEVTYKEILALVNRRGGRIVTSNLNRMKNQQSSGLIQLEVKASEGEEIRQALGAMGEVMNLRVNENPDAQNVTKSKRGFQVTLVAVAALIPRDSEVLSLAVPDVAVAFQTLQQVISKSGGRTLKADLQAPDHLNMTAQLHFDFRKEDENTLEKALADLGDVYARNRVRAQDGENVIDSKIRYQLSLENLTRLAPRETFVLGLEVVNVDKAVTELSAYVAEVKGRTLQSILTHEQNGQAGATLTYDVPLPIAQAVLDKFKSAGTVRSQQSTRNSQVPDSRLARARIEVRVSNSELLVPNDQGFWPQIRKGLSTSLVALSWSLTVVIVGLLFVLPWVLALYGINRLVLKMRAKESPISPVP